MTRQELLGFLLMAGSLVFAALSGGCTEPRHPGRDACYLAADKAAAKAYFTECADYPDTRVCPRGNAIEAEHAKAQESCP